MSVRLPIVSSVLASAVLGCSKAPAPTAAPTPAAAPTPTAAPAAPAAAPAAPAAVPTAPAPSAAPATPAGAPLEAGALKFAVPAAFEVQPPASPMRLAQMRLPGAAGDGLLTISQAGGTVEANIARWQGQFEGTPTVEKATSTPNGLAVTTVVLAGTYLDKPSPMAPGPGTPRPDYVMLGAVIETPAGPHFLKATGPKATLDALRGDFDRLVASVSLR